MTAGLQPVLFRVPVMAGEILTVDDDGQRLGVRSRPGFAGPEVLEVFLTRGIALLKAPRPGDYLIEYPTGHIDVMSAEAFSLKCLAGRGGEHE